MRGEAGHMTNATRHAMKNAESERARNMASPSSARTGRPGIFELDELGMRDGATANSSPQTATGHKQDDQIVKTKPPAGSCSRVLDQSMGSTRAH